MASQNDTFESIRAAMKKNTETHQEYLLQGSIKDEHLNVLLNKLDRLCDHHDLDIATFHRHVQCFVIKKKTRMDTTMAFSVRLLKSVDDPNEPARLIYIGQDETNYQRPTIVRTMIEIACDSNIETFLLEMGFEVDYEYYTKGYQFDKGRMHIEVSKILKVKPNCTRKDGDKDDGSNAEKQPEVIPLCGSYLVQLTVVATAKEDDIGNDMKVFAENLKPLVHLEKIDYRKPDSYFIEY